MQVEGDGGGVLRAAWPGGGLDARCAGGALRVGTRSPPQPIVNTSAIAAACVLQVAVMLFTSPDAASCFS